MFLKERLTCSSDRKPLFGLCCLQGTIKIPDIPKPPPDLVDLYSNMHFLSNIRKYNAGMSMASMKASREPFKGVPGIASYTIEGVVYRRIGPLRNAPGQPPACLQTYFYDTDTQVIYLLMVNIDNFKSHYLGFSC